MLIDLQDAPHLANQALLLEADQSFGHPRAAQSQHRGQVIVGDWQHAGVNSVTSKANPAREALFTMVPYPAQSCLDALKCQRLHVLEQMVSDLGMHFHDPTKILEANSVRASGKDDDRLMR
ncbi:hypothetical protein XH88_06500 [Bradyrhizobium sp. CCBAU 51627]|nr:hypothetical protein [Bradyrhizobium sp. CCBAU 51627]